MDGIKNPQTPQTPTPTPPGGESLDSTPPAPQPQQTPPQAPPQAPPQPPVSSVPPAPASTKSGNAKWIGLVAAALVVGLVAGYFLGSV